MLLTEYDEEKTLQAEYYAGERAGLEQGREQVLHHIIESAAKRVIPVSSAAIAAAACGVKDEADFRRRAAEQGITLPE